MPTYISKSIRGIAVRVIKRRSDKKCLDQRGIKNPVGVAYAEMSAEKDHASAEDEVQVTSP